MTRTTFEIFPFFQFLQILFAAFTRENLDIQPHGAVTLRRSEDFINKGIDKLLGDLAVLTVTLSIPKHLADTLHVAAKLLAGFLLFPKLGKLLFSGFDVGVALCRHGLEISGGDTVEGYQFQQLAFLFQGQLNGCLC